MNLVNLYTHRAIATVDVSFDELADYYWNNGNLEDFGRIMAAVYTNNIHKATDYLDDYFKDNMDKLPEFNGMSKHSMYISIENVEAESFRLMIEVEA